MRWRSYVAVGDSFTEGVATRPQGVMNWSPGRCGCGQT